MADTLPPLADAVDREALHAVARHAAAFAVAYGLEELHDDGWSYYPELGEDDWQRVMVLVVPILDAIGMGALGGMDPETYEAAYARLAVRAQAGA